jgi:hypothetical protein
VATLLVAAPISGSAQALAEGDGPPPRPNTLRLDVGVASAVGTLGIAFARTFGGLLQMEAGVGTGYSGTQLSLMPKIVLGSRDVYFVTGAGLSVASPTNPLHATGHLVWLNVDAVGLELISRHGFTFQGSAGITKGLGGGSICTNWIDGCEPGEKLPNAATVWGPQFRVGWGYSF